MTISNQHPLDQRPLADLLKLAATAWISPKEAAAILGVTTDALATRRSRGDWPHAIKFCMGLTSSAVPYRSSWRRVVAGSPVGFVVSLCLAHLGGHCLAPMCSEASFACLS
jgi:hypothetical protein